ncbi:MAG: ABC transporter permease subunit [Desulfatirhabdiaceae bacterium]
MPELVYIGEEVLPALFKGLWISLILILPSSVLGLAAGVLVGTLRVYGATGFRWLTNVYVLVFRGFPLIVQLYIW